MSSSEPAQPVGRIAAGYAFSEPALDLGALMWDGRTLPDAQIRVPLGMLNGTAWSPSPSSCRRRACPCSSPT